MTAQLSDLPVPAVLLFVIADKLTGNLVEDALSTVQSHWLATAAVNAPMRSPSTITATPSTSSAGGLSGLVSLASAAGLALLSPVACQSLGEIAETVMGSAVKVAVEHQHDGGVAQWLVSNVAVVVPALVVYAGVAHWRMAAAAAGTPVGVAEGKKAT